ncbi:CopG family transcriptional regulator [Sulfurovum sp.]|uniref:CopG family transcriptional regulator n=1 Tax=Sulfurovum sp. TaxID=1969726 RepID=UPI0025D676F7|nr:CopG family transcriptional regulator [Sulfurovum sp.]
MKTMSLRMPDYLKNAVNDVCANEKISLNQFIVNALSEKVSALQTLDIIEKRAERASKESFLEALSKVPSVEPDERDKL